jgi:pimeloyl-ACP methyl ester carboxylesterase
MPRLANYTIGTGTRPTVLLHGFLGSGKNLRSLAQRWAEREPDRLFHIPDLTGHGASPPLLPDADLGALAADLLETAQAWGGPLSIAGHSLGGRVALAAARVAPRAISDIALIDIAPGPITDRFSDSRRVLRVLLEAPDEAPERRDLRRFLVDRGLSPGTADWLVMNVRLEDGRYHWTFDRQALDRLSERVGGEDLWDVVEARQVPVRAIRGEWSGYVTEEDVRRFESAGVRVHTLPGAGHDVHVEALEPLVAALVARAA